MPEKRKPERAGSSYQPTKAELEEDLRIKGATPGELLAAVLGRHPYTEKGGE